MNSTSIIFIILHLTILWNKTHGLIGYYCKLPLPAITISLLEVGKCTSQGTASISETYLQFLRVSQNNIFINDCHFDRYNVLHEGMGKKFIGVNSNYFPIFAGIKKNYTFALRSTGQRNMCGYTIYTTKYPELFIFETEKNESPFVTKREITTDHKDIFDYVNAKFIYPNIILRSISIETQLLYHDVLLHECNIRRENVEYAISAFISGVMSPDLFAYIIMETRGYMAVPGGETALIIQCVPIEVAIRKTKYCYNELPVSYNNDNFFLTPVTHILINNGTKIKCSSEMPVKFFIDNEWYEVFPEPKLDETVIPESITNAMFTIYAIFSTIVYIVFIIIAYIIIYTISILFRRLFLTDIIRYICSI